MSSWSTLRKKGVPLSTDVSQNLVTISIDGKEIQAGKGELLIAAAEKAGVFIPRFCYHNRLPQVGMCRMCLVEVNGPRGFSLQPACYLPVADGMEVVTESEKVKKAQDGVLEYLLINHPLDCPVCDKGGECPLQDQTMAYGPGESRFAEEKRHWEKPIPISDLVLLDRERCIQCDRCTRFADVVAGDALIEFVGRGDHTEINVFPDRPFSSYFSGNTVQICPVGALTAVPYRFKARPWDLSQVESSCTTCSMGCRIMVQSSQNELTRYLGLDADSINHGWLCDKGRFGHEAINSSDRLTAPLVRKGDSFVETTWASALELISSKVSSAKAAGDPNRIGFILGARLTNEDIYSWVKLAKGVIGSDSVDSQLGDGLKGEVVASLSRATINEAVSAKAILAFTGDIKEEVPVLFLRLREAVKSGWTKIATIGTHGSSLDKLSEVTASVSVDQLQLLAKELMKESSKFPEIAKLFTNQGVGADGEGLVVLLGRENLAWDQSIVEAFALELSRALPRAKFLVTLHSSNFAGSVDLGAVPGMLPGRLPLESASSAARQKWAGLPDRAGRGVKEMLAAALQGELDVLFLVGSDPREDYVDSALANSALDQVGFVVSVDTFLSQSSAKSDLVLPASSFAEKSGTTTNLEGRVLTLNQKVAPKGLCRPDWAIASEIALELGDDLGFDSAAGVLDEIAEVSPLHWGLSWKRLVKSSAIEGMMIPISATSLSIRPKAMLDEISTPGIASVWDQGLPSSKTAYVENGASSEDDQLAGEPSSQAGAGTVEPKWRLAPVQPLGFMNLAYSRKLYSQGEHLRNSAHLVRLAVEPKCRVSSKTAEKLGLSSGGSVLIADKAGGEGQFELEVDDSVPNDTVELVRGSFTIPGFSPVRSDETVNYVKVERA